MVGGREEDGKGWCFDSLENLHQSQACFSPDLLRQAPDFMESRPLNSASNIIYKQAL